MSATARFLEAAFPSVPAELSRAAAAEFVSSAGGAAAVRVFEDRVAALVEENGSLREEVSDLRDECMRLNTEIVRHKDGVVHATSTRAGLDVLGERARQRRLEGYDDAHDDEHEDYALTAAAISYASHAKLLGLTGRGFDTAPSGWPWEPEAWKHKAVRIALVVAAALLIAEIERLDRRSAAS